MFISYYEDIKLFQEIENFIISLGFKAVEGDGFHLLRTKAHDYEFHGSDYEIMIIFYNEGSWHQKDGKDEHVVYLQLYKIRKPFKHGDLLVELEFNLKINLKPKTLSVLKLELIKLKSKFDLPGLRLSE